MHTLVFVIVPCENKCPIAPITPGGVPTRGTEKVCGLGWNTRPGGSLRCWTCDNRHLAVSIYIRKGFAFNYLLRASIDIPEIQFHIYPSSFHLTYIPGIEMPKFSLYLKSAVSLCQLIFIIICKWSSVHTKVSSGLGPLDLIKNIWSCHRIPDPVFIRIWLKLSLETNSSCNI